MNGDKFLRQVLTRSAFLYLFRHDRKNEESIGHYRRSCIDHFLIRRHFIIDFETSKEGFYAFKGVNKSVLAWTNILGCL